MSVAASTAIGIGIAAGTAGAGIYSAHKQADSATQSGAIQASGAQSALDFQKQQEAERKAEWQQAQDKNYALYQEQQARLAPYRAMGQATLGQLAQPIPGMTIGDLAKRGS